MDCFCKPYIIKKTEEGYAARYVTDQKTTFIPNINDEKFVRFSHAKNKILETFQFLCPVLAYASSMHFKLIDSS
jgi:hypothetical protein